MAKTAKMTTAKPESEAEALQRRADRIWKASDVFRQGLKDIHEYMLPYRQDVQQTGGQQESYVDRIFDGSGVNAAFRFAPRAQGDITPPFENFFDLQAGAAFPAGEQRDQLNKQLVQITSQARGVLDTSNFDTASLEMYYDFFAGNGYMLMLPAPSPDVMRFVPVPSMQGAMGMDPWGDVGSVVWKRSWPAEDLPEMWPRAVWSDELKQQIDNEQDKPIEVCQYTRHMLPTTRWRHVAMIKGNHELVDDQTFNTKPWLTPRFFVVPGDPMGRGPAHIALPFVKTANVSREFALKAAAFSLLGLWAYENDSVFDPSQSDFTPGKFWNVAKTGGSFGATLQRLPVPQDFDISTIVLEDERNQIKQATFDNQLPPDTGAVRSATEIVERMKADSQNWGGVPIRARREIVHTLVRRVVDVLYEKRMIESQLQLDQFILKVDVTSPMMRAKRAQAVQPIIEFVSMLQAIGGREYAALVAKLEDVGTAVGQAMGISPDLLRTETERGQLQRMVAQIIAQGQQAPVSEDGAPPAAPGEVAQ